MDITAQVISDFRTYYPEFSDSNTWPDADLRRALEAADDETGSGRWGTYKASPASFKARGLYSYAAHAAVLSRQSQRAVENGNVAAAPSPVQSKTVGDESISYAVQTPETGNRADTVGNLNVTVYGQEFLRLRKRAGMGAATTGQVNLR